MFFFYFFKHLIQTPPPLSVRDRFSNEADLSPSINSLLSSLLSPSSLLFYLSPLFYFIFLLSSSLLLYLSPLSSLLSLSSFISSSSPSPFSYSPSKHQFPPFSRPSSPFSVDIPTSGGERASSPALRQSGGLWRRRPSGYPASRRPPALARDAGGQGATPTCRCQLEGRLSEGVEREG